MTSQKYSKKEVQQMLASNNLSLSEEYIGIARHNFLYKKSYRGVIDTAYNACELAVKGCLAFSMENLPSTHKGLVIKFSEIFVKTKKLTNLSEESLPDRFGIETSLAMKRILK